MDNRELKQQTSFENRRLGNGVYFVVIASSFHPLMLTEHAANGLGRGAVEVNIENVECSRCH